MVNVSDLQCWCSLKEHLDLDLEFACFAYYLNASLEAQILLGVVKLD